MSEDFKSITITFNKANQDVKDIIKGMVDKTGKTKVDIICSALRQYQLNTTTINNNIDKDDIKGMVKESLLEILLQNQFSGGIQVQQPQMMNMEVIQEKNKDEIEKERLNSLNNKNIDVDLLDDDD
ncbi:hypothetical protein [Clostridium botulinum]|uniref:hypothetical protein n=1 Tax=Clostridium botulinum TaxID=1491 RepID=UPI001E589C92|nr:hypothetical protein [Clostridium botulinum]MCD3254352.1 hypothetical protein [Clostridium botulinum C/D]MCD3279852.1 hypothetical protein [Clostridium botulinum C/D]MCD3339583.1 hypothetical protein [Clostridium botulinum C/D]MCD3357491.1 hypothetical protein [Clostridium botulinum C/D]